VYERWIDPVYAVVETGGRQYRMSAGGNVRINRLEAEPGEQVEFENILLIGGNEETKIGQPFVPGAKVKATVVDQGREKKIIVLKFKPKRRYRRKAGHRQHYTQVFVNEILAGE
jgi:large subunit ribosomal protein L21